MAGSRKHSLISESVSLAFVLGLVYVFAYRCTPTNVIDGGFIAASPAVTRKAKTEKIVTPVQCCVAIAWTFVPHGDKAIAGDTLTFELQANGASVPAYTLAFTLDKPINDNSLVAFQFVTYLRDDIFWNTNLMAKLTHKNWHNNAGNPSLLYGFTLTNRPPGTVRQ